MNVIDYLKVQEENYCRAFSDPTAYPIAISSVNDFDAAGLVASYEIKWDIRTRNKNAFTRVSSTHSEYWVRPKYTGYRKAFKMFLHDYYGVDPVEISSELDVDHIFSHRLAVVNGIGYVQLALVAKQYNRYFGVRVEKSLIKLYNNQKKMYLIDYYATLKVLRISFPRSKDEFISQAADIADIISKKVKEPPILIYESLLGELQLWDVYA
jgi:hypothetical protein